MSSAVERDFRIGPNSVENTSQNLVHRGVRPERFTDPLDVAVVLVQQVEHLAAEQLRNGEFHHVAGLGHLLCKPSGRYMVVAQRDDVREAQARVAAYQERIAHLVLLPLERQLFQPAELLRREESFLRDHLLDAEAVERVAVDKVTFGGLIEQRPKQT